MSKIEKPSNVPELPVDLWRRIASKDPAGCLALTGVTKEIRAATADMAKAANRMHPDKVGRIQRMQAQRLARKNTRFIDVRLIPGISEASEMKFDGIICQPTGPVGWLAMTTAHVALFPLVLPMRLGWRIRGKQYKLKADKIEIAQKQQELFKSIASDARWLSVTK